MQATDSSPSIRTTTVGSYAQMDWLLQSAGTEQAVLDATSVVIATQRQAGIDLPTDGEPVKATMSVSAC